jgi:hypothetical protein
MDCPQKESLRTCASLASAPGRAPHSHRALVRRAIAPQPPPSSNCALSRRERRQWSRSGRAARYWAILATTLAADVQDDIAGHASFANRQDHIGRSTLARTGIHRRSASSGCTPLGAKANHREPRLQPRLSDEAPNVLFPVAANRRSSAANRPAR